MADKSTMTAFTTGYRNPLSRVYHAFASRSIGHGTVLRHDVPVPQIKAHEVLIKVHSVAQNPTDWKHADFISPSGAILGCDFAGTVAEIGPEAKGGLKIGDRVAAVAHGGLYKDEGAYAEYAKMEGDTVWRVPDSLSFQDAVTYGASCLTGMMALYHRMDIPWPDETQATDKPELFVYSGSSAAGLMMLQMAAHAGYKVATTASPRNFELCKRYGASDVYDYRSPTAEPDIKRDYPNVTRAVDCYSDGGAFAFCERILSASTKVTPENKGHLVSLLPKGPNDSRTRGNVFSESIAAYTLSGRPFAMFPLLGIKWPAMPEDRAALERFYKMLPGLLDWLKPLPTEFIVGGFSGIPLGFDRMRKGKVSGQKLVLQLADD